MVHGFARATCVPQQRGRVVVVIITRLVCVQNGDTESCTSQTKSGLSLQR